MATTVPLNIRVDSEMKRMLRLRARLQGRSLSNQTKRYLEIAVAAEDNPDLPFPFIADILQAKNEIAAGLVVLLARDDETAVDQQGGGQ